MVLVDTGPWVALFDPKDERHSRCREMLGGIKESLSTTVPVLTEAFHILEPQSVGSSRCATSPPNGALRFGTSIVARYCARSN